MPKVFTDLGLNGLNVYSDMLILREYDAVYTSNGSLCRDFFLKRKDELIIQKNPPDHLDFQSLAFKKANNHLKIKSALWIKWLNFDHFGHLLTETISSVCPLLSEQNQCTDNNTLILIPSRQALRGIEKLKIIFPEKELRFLSVADLESPIVECDQLMLAKQSMINKMYIDDMHFVNVRKFLDRYMRYYLKVDLKSTVISLPASYSQYIRTNNPNSRKNVYLSRSLLPAQKRLFDDEVEIENQLLSHGWCVVHLEKLPLNIQLQVLSEANSIAGARGSAFHLLMALEPSLLRHKKIVFLNRQNKLRKKIKDTFEVQFDAQKLEYKNLRCLLRYVETNHHYPRIRLVDDFTINDIVQQINFIKT